MICWSNSVFLVSVSGDNAMFPRMPVMNGMMGPNPGFSTNPMLPGAGIPSTFSHMHRMPFPDPMR